MDETLTVYDKRLYLLRHYPSGIMNGRFILQMPDSQVLAIYATMQKPRKPKNVKGQMSLFDNDIRTNSI